MTIGYEHAKNLMVQLDWKAKVTMDISSHDTVLERVTLYHPRRENTYNVRRDSAKRLLAECRVCGRVDDRTAIMCYDHDGSNEELI